MKWISIKDRLPYLFQDVLVTDGSKPFEYIVAMYMGRHVGWNVSSFNQYMSNSCSKNSNLLDSYVAFWCKIPDLEETINGMD